MALERLTKFQKLFDHLRFAFADDPLPYHEADFVE